MGTPFSHWGKFNDLVEYWTRKSFYLQKENCEKKNNRPQIESTNSLLLNYPSSCSHGTTVWQHTQYTGELCMVFLGFVCTSPPSSKQSFETLNEQIITNREENVIQFLSDRGTQDFLWMDQSRRVRIESTSGLLTRIGKSKSHLFKKSLTRLAEQVDEIIEHSDLHWECFI